MEKSLIPSRGDAKAKSVPEEAYLDYEVKTIIPVVRNIPGTILYIFLSIITIGLFALIAVWNKKLVKSLRYTKCSINEAKFLVIINEFGEEDLLEIEIRQGPNGPAKVVMYRYMDYFLDEDCNRFFMILNYLRFTNQEVRAFGGGLESSSVPIIRSFSGINSTKIELDNVFKLFIEEVLTSFNLYQFFAVVIWHFRNYQEYSYLILACTFVSMIFSVWVIRSEQKKINSMANTSLIKVIRRNNGQTIIEEIDSTLLVPGDVVEIKSGSKLPCDVILLDGQCLIDEAVLTGESIPMHKTQLPKSSILFSEKEKAHMVFAGTSCITSDSMEYPDEPARGIVYQTKFGTTKGLLIRSIMFNNPGLYKFEKDGNLFLAYLIGISLCFIAVYYFLMFTSSSAEPDWSIVLPSIDIMLTMVPPGLTLCLSIGVQYAQSRLRKKQVSALKGRLINASGRMKVVFFDKTGTLTVNEVKLDGVYLADLSKNNADCLELQRDGFRYIQASSTDLSSYSQMELMHNFAVNHTLILSKTNQVLGDPLEEELMNFAGGSFQPTQNVNLDADHVTLVSPVIGTASGTPIPQEEKNGKKLFPAMKTLRVAKDGAQTNINILDIFVFKPELQRMSVLTQNTSTRTIHSYVKGAPEKVISLCDPVTLPKNIDAQVSEYAKKGYRVLAFATAQIPIDQVPNATREISETNLAFQGFTLFKNNLKEATKPTLDKLKYYDFHTGMITGDNINTAVSVAKTCGLIDTRLEDIALTHYDEQTKKLRFQLINEHGDPVREINIESRGPSEKRLIGALEAKCFAKIVQENQLELNKDIDLKIPVLSQIANHVRVFARMNPEQKAIIVKIMKTYFKKDEFTVGYCGDGANDCIALKHADIGVSLSKTEASLSAPFVSAIEDISCIETISILGKAALTTNFDCFRYFCLYSIIQTIGLLMLSSQQTEYSVAMYITMDVPLALNLANCIGLLHPTKTMQKKMPKFTLLYPKFLISILYNSLFTVFFMCWALQSLRTDPEFVRSRYLASDAFESALASWDATVISLMAIQGTWHIALSFNIAGNFKERFYKQVYIMVSIVIYILFIFYLLYNDGLDFMKSVNDFLMENYNFVYLSKGCRVYILLLMLFYAICSIALEAILIWVYTPVKAEKLKVNPENLYAGKALEIMSPVIQPDVHTNQV